MKKNDRYKNTIIGCLCLLVLSVSLIILLKNSNIHRSEEKQPSTTVIEDETTTKSPEEERQETLEALSAWFGQLPEIQTYLSMNQSDNDAFSNWFLNQYGIDLARNLTSNDATQMKHAVYSMTNKSIFVLIDEFLALNSYQTISTGRQNANIMFAGDICLTEQGFVLDRYKETNQLSDCISQQIIDMTNSADLFMLNNEFSISDRGVPLAGKLYTFRANPERTKLLKELGVDLVSLANNHVYDYGSDAFYDTMNYLNESGIPYVGGGSTEEEAQRAVYFNVNGIKIGFVSASNAERFRFTPGATSDSPGIFLMYEPARFYDICTDAANRCDYLIAFVHWGTEDSKYFEQYQHDMAAELIRRGVDTIIGAHPHVLQGVEYIEGKPVVYSLGDFWFNNETKYNGLIRLTIDSDGYVSMGMSPTKQTEFHTVDITDPAEQQAYRDYVNELSSGCQLGTDFQFQLP